MREGTWLGLGKVGNVELVKWLDKERSESKIPWFRFAAYRAIDHILINIQIFGGKKECEKLKEFLPNAKDKEVVHTCVEWTIDPARLLENTCTKFFECF